MLDGWYCRSIANMQANEAASASNSVSAEAPNSRDSRKDYSSDSSSDPEPEPNYKAQYLTLKKKLKYLIYVSIQDCLVKIEFVHNGSKQEKGFCSYHIKFVKKPYCIHTSIFS